MRERATRMAVSCGRIPDTRQCAIPRVAEQFGMHLETFGLRARQDLPRSVRPPLVHPVRTGDPEAPRFPAVPRGSRRFPAVYGGSGAASSRAFVVLGALDWTRRRAANIAS